MRGHTKNKKEKLKKKGAHPLEKKNLFSFWLKICNRKQNKFCIKQFAFFFSFASSVLPRATDARAQEATRELFFTTGKEKKIDFVRTWKVLPFHLRRRHDYIYIWTV